MPSLRYRYRKIGNNYFPIIKVKLKGPKREISVEALVDSGAGDCLFHREIGEIIGLDIEKGKYHPSSGVKGDFDAYIHPVKIQINQRILSIEVSFGDYSKRSFAGLLGQKGFFDNFDVIFKKRKNEFEIRWKE